MNRTGWVPIRFDGQFVDWCWLGPNRFTDPFFDATIENARRLPFNALFTHRTPIAELGEWYAQSPGLAPTGFIFHMSRCGSTLVSRLLAALPENVVIAEASPIDRLARAFSIPEATRAEWLRWMVGALGQKRAGAETRYFIKFDAPTVLALPLIRRAFPAVPWIFLYRNPEEVLVSHLRHPAPAMAPGFVTDIRWMDAPPGAEEYAAHALGAICQCAVEGMDECGLVVNYNQLPEAIWGAIARRFGIEFSPAEVERMRQLALQNAKRPRQNFTPDGDAKRREISDAARTAAARWILPRYAQLERLSGAAKLP